MNGSFFPLLIRSKNYPVKDDGAYYVYSYYYSYIEADCKSRCVYCDVSLLEIGGEGMCLDHFRPQHIFVDLKNNPYNLVLACPKCNRLKSKRWPTNDQKENNGLVGFFDPFVEDRSKYFAVKPDGRVDPHGAVAKYLLDTLLLNRPSRVQLRRLRILRSECEAFVRSVEERLRLLREKVGVLTREQISDELDRILYLFERYKLLFE